MRLRPSLLGRPGRADLHALTECDLCRDLAPGQAPASGRVCQYMTQQPDALTDRRCADATVCGALGELTPLEETRDRTCVGSG